MPNRGFYSYGSWIHSKIISGATFRIIGLTKIPKMEFLPLDWIYRSIRIITVVASIYLCKSGPILGFGCIFQLQHHSLRYMLEYTGLVTHSHNLAHKLKANCSLLRERAKEEYNKNSQLNQRDISWSHSKK